MAKDIPLAGIMDPEHERYSEASEVRQMIETDPDVVESGGGDGTANITSHHNVGGLPDDVEFELVEPLRLLFKDEVRAVEFGHGNSLNARSAPPEFGETLRGGRDYSHSMVPMTEFNGVALGEYGLPG